MIAIDTNILVYARRTEAPHHREALALLTELAEGERLWAIPWPVVYEYVRVVTHPKVFFPPSPLDNVIQDFTELARSPALMLLGEGPAHLSIFAQTMLSADARGNIVHDAHIAALALEHGATEILTCDKDLMRFSPLRSRNPFISEGKR